MPSKTPAVNQLPVSVILLFLPIVLVEAYFAGAQAGLWGGLNTRLLALQQFIVIPEIVDLSIQAGRWSWDWMLTFVTYPFFSASILQATFGAVFVLAIGKFVGEAMGDFAVFTIFFAATIVGATAYVLFTSADYPLFGAFPAAYGLIGGFTYVQFALAGNVKEQQIKAFQLIGVLMLINLAFSLVTGGPPTWVAELVGAITGFLTAAALRPGGLPQLLETLRRR